MSTVPDSCNAAGDSRDALNGHTLATILGAMNDARFFSAEEYNRRLESVREKIDERRLAGCLVFRPENIFYLTGLNYQGYFAYQMLVVPLDGVPILVTGAMERATVGGSLLVSSGLTPVHFRSTPEK